MTDVKTGAPAFVAPTVSAALRAIDNRLGNLEKLAGSELSEAQISSFERRVSFLQKWGWVLGAIGVIFSAGIAYAVFMGANATDDEVQEEVQRAVFKHNDYVDADAVDPTTHRRIGHHPDLREAIRTNTEAITALTEAQRVLADTQHKLDKRSRYQYEYTKWEVQKAECRRARNCTRRDLKKPELLEQLEAELIND